MPWSGCFHDSVQHPDGMLSLDQLRTLAGDGSIDTVVLAMPDMQGRLQGKRLPAGYFLDEVLAHGSEACRLPARR